MVLVLLQYGSARLDSVLTRGWAYVLSPSANDMTRKKASILPQGMYMLYQVSETDVFDGNVKKIKA